jgi:hypothetical protein
MINNIGAFFHSNVSRSIYNEMKKDFITRKLRIDSIVYIPSVNIDKYDIEYFNQFFKVSIAVNKDYVKFERL